MELRGLTAERRHADGVLEQPAGVGMVRLGRGQPTQRRAQRVVGHESSYRLSQPCVRDLACEELQEPVELIRVSPHRGHELRGVGLRRFQ